MTNSPTTSQEDEIRLKETLEDAIDGRRFDHNFPKLNFSDIERVIQYILPTVQAEIATATNRARKDYATKLNALYTELENAKPPQTPNKSEAQWNDGFYRGQLKAMELASVRLFNMDGDELSKQEEDKRKH